VTDLAHLSIEELEALDLCECGRKLSTYPDLPKLVWRSWQAEKQHDESKVADRVAPVPWTINGNDSRAKVNRRGENDTLRQPGRVITARMKNMGAS
jgi:hypothetical protein